MKVLITAGPTREAIDDVRFLSNHATGGLGCRIADLARERGHEVTILLGPTPLSPHAEGVSVYRYESAQDLFELIQQHFPASDCLIASAAVADYRPKEKLDGKLKKQDGDLTLELERTPDSLLWAGQNKRADQCLIGFALEANPDPALAQAKLERKRCDLLVHNSPDNFGAGGGWVRIIDANSEVYAGSPQKEELAALILRAMEKHTLGQ